MQPSLLVVIKLAAGALDDCQQLDHVLVSIGLDVSVRSLDFCCQAPPSTVQE
jgi:hypothetical protein